MRLPRHGRNKTKGMSSSGDERPGPLRPEFRTSEADSHQLMDYMCRGHSHPNCVEGEHEEVSKGHPIRHESREQEWADR